MKIDKLTLLEHVALTQHLPEHGLKIGDNGMILYIYANHKGYEVEFVTLNGELIALMFVYPSQIHQLKKDEIARSRRVKTA